MDKRARSADATENQPRKDREGGVDGSVLELDKTLSYGDEASVVLVAPDFTVSLVGTHFYVRLHAEPTVDILLAGDTEWYRNDLPMFSHHEDHVGVCPTVGPVTVWNAGTGETVWSSLTPELLDEVQRTAFAISSVGMIVCQPVTTTTSLVLTVVYADPLKRGVFECKISAPRYTLFTTPSCAIIASDKGLGMINICTDPMINTVRPVYPLSLTILLYTCLTVPYVLDCTRSEVYRRGVSYQEC
jgi:hypothetical protein